MENIGEKMVETRLSKDQVLKNLEHDLLLLEHYIEDALNTVGHWHMNKDSEEYKGIDIASFVSDNTAFFSAFANNRVLSPWENVTLLMGLATIFRPQAFNSFLIHNAATKRLYAEFGGALSASGGVFMPTIQTALFLLAGNDIGKRLEAERYLLPESYLFEKNFLNYHQDGGQVYWYNAVLVSSIEFLSYLSDKPFRPTYSPSFSAERISTQMSASDLFLDYDTEIKVNEIRTWLKFGDELLEHNELRKKVKPGYRALFYGPSGTGKTLTAKILGKEHGMDVYRVDLSMIVSKWVGETEKNLKQVFDMAENKNWILFFDEADAIFGKRSQVNNSNDRYANQEIAYLLQRTEEYNGLIILASNLKANIDAAFNRRFNSMIYFPSPNEDLREKIWEHTIPEDFVLEDVITLQKLRKVDLSGGEILNVIHYCVLKAIERKDKRIVEEDMTYAIRKELTKKGKA